MPNNLIDVYKTKWMGAALEFLTQYHHDGDEFLDRIVTGDGTSVLYKTPENMHRYMEWHHSNSPQNPEKKNRI